MVHTLQLDFSQMNYFFLEDSVFYLNLGWTLTFQHETIWDQMESKTKQNFKDV